MFIPDFRVHWHRQHLFLFFKIHDIHVKLRTKLEMLDLTEFLKIFSLHNSMETRIKNLYVFFAALTLRSWSLWVETIIYKKLFREGWYLRCPICALVLGYWELSHMIFLLLRKKELLAKALQFHKLTIVFTQNGPRWKSRRILFC